jgi:hypothetical protein
MQKLLSDYLLQKKYCALPNVGIVQRKTNAATSVFGDQKIASPISIYELVDDQILNNDFAKFVASQNHITQDEAIEKVKLLSEEISNVKQHEFYTIPFVGAFTKNEDDKIIFSDVKIPEIFAPQVYAERVIHPNDSHTMLVGDTETNTTAMMEYYAAEESSKKVKWWVWALIIAAIAIAGLAYYFFTDNHNASFGNANKINFFTKDSTYKFVK